MCGRGNGCDHELFSFKSSMVATGSLREAMEDSKMAVHLLSESKKSQGLVKSKVMRTRLVSTVDLFNAK